MRKPCIFVLALFGVCALAMVAAAAARTTQEDDNNIDPEEASSMSYYASDGVKQHGSASHGSHGHGTHWEEDENEEEEWSHSKHSSKHVHVIEGRHGKNGKDGADGPRGPAGADGRPGKDGEDGRRGEDGHLPTLRYVSTGFADKTVTCDSSTGQRHFAGTITAGAKCATGYKPVSCNCDTKMSPAFEVDITEGGDYKSGWEFETNFITVVKNALVATNSDEKNTCACTAMYGAVVSDCKHYEDEEEEDPVTKALGLDPENPESWFSLHTASTRKYYEDDNDVEDPYGATPPHKPSYDTYKDDNYAGKDGYKKEGSYDKYAEDSYRKGGSYDDKYKSGDYEPGYSKDKYKSGDYKGDSYNKDTYKGDGYNKEPGYNKDTYKGGDYNKDKYKGDGYKGDSYNKEPGYKGEDYVKFNEPSYKNDGYDKEPGYKAAPAPKSAYGKDGYKPALPPHLYKDTPSRDGPTEPHKDDDAYHAPAPAPEPYRDSKPLPSIDQEYYKETDRHLEVIYYHGGKKHEGHKQRLNPRDSPYYTKGAKKGRHGGRRSHAKVASVKGERDYYDNYGDDWPERQTFSLSATVTCLKSDNPKDYYSHSFME